MTSKNSSIAISTLRRHAGWVALLPIAWLQLTIAVHQFDHAGYIDDYCHVCVQLDRIDAAVDHAPERAPLPSLDVVAVAVPSITLNRDAVLHFDSRAPPTL